MQSLFRTLPQHTVARRCAKSLELPQNGFLRGNQRWASDRNSGLLASLIGCTSATCRDKRSSAAFRSRPEGRRASPSHTPMSYYGGGGLHSRLTVARRHDWVRSPTPSCCGPQAVPSSNKPRRWSITARCSQRCPLQSSSGLGSSPSVVFICVRRTAQRNSVIWGRSAAN